MELVSASTKTEGDDNSECSSSNVVAALAAGEDQSEKDQSISPNAVAFWSLAWQNLWERGGGVFSFREIKRGFVSWPVSYKEAHCLSVSSLLEGFWRSDLDISTISAVSKGGTFLWSVSITSLHHRRLLSSGFDLE
ncbi:hypothetical protein IMY05_006G0062100 [Salix suchowensis]|nr:hypothetical protein IMY05_006G0062100 [Salix suchowensis]